jgi:hypothetical protein
VSANVSSLAQSAGERDAYMHDKLRKHGLND